MDTLIFLQIYVLVPLQKIEFLGLKIDSTRTTLTLPKGKVKAIRIKCQKLISNPNNNTVGSDQPCRFSLLDSTGSTTSYTANQVFTTTANSIFKKQS